jgi:ATP:ADP antiporter, AAA family
VDERAVIGGSAWEGFRSVFRSPYLLGISGYVLILTVVATFIYFTRLQMVAALGDDLDMRTTVFAQIDLVVQITTLVLQVLVAGHVMKRFGVAVTLALLPVTAILGFTGLALVGSLTVFIAFDAAFRAVQRALTRPARETLFTVVGREDKYKSKAFIDTFVYRGGDVLGAWTEGLLGRLGMGLAALTLVAVPLAVVWAMLGVWLGRAQMRQAARRPPPRARRRARQAWRSPLSRASGGGLRRRQSAQAIVTRRAETRSSIAGLRSRRHGCIVPTRIERGDPRSGMRPSAFFKP